MNKTVAKPPTAKVQRAIAKAIKAAGGTAAVAKHFGLSRQAIDNWRKRGVPPRRVMSLERLCKRAVVREELKPEWYR